MCNSVLHLSVSESSANTAGSTESLASAKSNVSQRTTSGGMTPTIIDLANVRSPHSKEPPPAYSNVNALGKFCQECPEFSQAGADVVRCLGFFFGGEGGLWWKFGVCCCRRLPLKGHNEMSFFPTAG